MHLEPLKIHRIMDRTRHGGCWFSDEPIPRILATDGKVAAIGKLNLNDRAAARRAIVMHEIFSPPKAMRSQPETWES